jgi:N-acyl-D-aspartate/D-glutamate deacylase
MSQHALVIRGETLVDGTGDAPRVGDLAIDGECFGLENPEMRHDFPASGRRLYQGARGYVATIVSGQVIFEEGQATGALPGKLIRGTQPGVAE